MKHIRPQWCDGPPWLADKQTIKHFILLPIIWGDNFQKNVYQPY